MFVCFGYLVVWLFGCLVVWLFGCLVFGVVVVVVVAVAVAVVAVVAARFRQLILLSEGSPYLLEWSRWGRMWRRTRHYLKSSKTPYGALGQLLRAGSIILGKMKHQSSPGFPKLQPDKKDGLSFITPFTEMILFGESHDFRKHPELQKDLDIARYMRYRTSVTMDHHISYM